MNSADIISQLVSFSAGSRSYIDPAIQNHIFNGLARHLKTGESIYKCLPEFRGGPRRYQRMRRDINLMLAVECFPMSGDINRARALLTVIRKIKETRFAHWQASGGPPPDSPKVYFRVFEILACGERVPTTPGNVCTIVSKTRAKFPDLYG